jgi:hypothetical protein
MVGCVVIKAVWLVMVRGNLALLGRIGGHSLALALVSARETSLWAARL